MIDLEKEKPISPAAAAQLLPAGRLGRPVSESCVLRWIQKGVEIGSGERVRLEGLRLGRRWITSVAALQRFAARQTPENVAEPAPLSRSAEQRTRASETAAKELLAIGI